MRRKRGKKRHYTRGKEGMIRHQLRMGRYQQFSLGASEDAEEEEAGVYPSQGEVLKKVWLRHF